ncbi:MAG: HDOD domain-containing protein [Proteobacteria bacterium]|nr:HDOD domain-containing protein [Pseudomonadota bacterium]MBU1741140.1 HDOD domain-containing protein [Pseudomonadota bacterium]
MTRILFVDDETNILDALKRMLHSMRREWDMTFVDSGPAALEHLARETVDIIVSDNRMPGMDGSQLLEEVRRRYPKMIRIVLSGHAEQESVMKSVKAAHQYLAKPCEAETLKAVIRRASSLGRLLTNESLVGLISRIDALPALPAGYQKLRRELDSEDASLERVGRLIAEDVGMSATILKLVNSAFFGVAREIASPSQAVVLLGLDIVRGLVLSHHIFSTFDTKKLRGFGMEDLQRHCRITGGLARLIARDAGAVKSVVDEAYVAGLIHDVGKLVLSSVAPERYNQVLEGVRRGDRLVVEVEREVLGLTHSEAGGYLLGLWGLPEGVVEALIHHHRPSSGSGQGFRPVTAVHLANVLDHELRVVNENYAPRTLDEAYLAANDLTDQVPRWREMCREVIVAGETDEPD